MNARWTIEVCRTCGKLATIPFCEHRDMPPPFGTLTWCEPITVRGAWHRTGCTYRAMIGGAPCNRPRTGPDDLCDQHRSELEQLNAANDPSPS